MVDIAGGDILVMDAVPRTICPVVANIPLGFSLKSSLVLITLKPTETISNCLCTLYECSSCPHFRTS